MLNTQSIGWFATSDGHLESISTRRLIHLLQLVLALAGLLSWTTRVFRFAGSKQLLLLFISTLLSLGLIEIGTRIWLTWIASPEQQQVFSLHTDIPQNRWQWSPHHYLNYYPTPGFQRGKTHHNSLGFRGDEFSSIKQDGVFRIAILGGSTTYTIAVEDDELTFPAQLEAMLQEQVSKKKIQVINAGVGGYNSWESLINLQFRVLDLSPDLVIVYHGTNDVHPRLVPPAIYRSDNSGRRQQWTIPRIPPAEQFASLRVLLRKMGYSSQVGLETLVNRQPAILESSKEIISLLDQNPPVYFRRNLRSMITSARDAGAQIVLATWAHSPHFNDYAALEGYQYGFKQNNAVVREVATATSTPCFDFSEQMPQDSEYWADGRHVNVAGALKKAELFAQYLINANMLPLQ